MGSLAGAIVAQDITSAPFNVGSVVNVRCTVGSIVGAGAGAAVTVSLEQPGLVGQRAATFVVSPSQCRKASAVSVLSGN